MISGGIYKQPQAVMNRQLPNQTPNLFQKPCPEISLGNV